MHHSPPATMETTTSSSESVDEFFGDQSSEPDTSDLNHAYSETSNGAAAHEYRSRESSIKTLSYLDGFDETKEEKVITNVHSIFDRSHRLFSDVRDVWHQPHHLGQ